MLYRGDDLSKFDKTEIQHDTLTALRCLDLRLVTVYYTETHRFIAKAYISDWHSFEYVGCTNNCLIFNFLDFAILRHIQFVSYKYESIVVTSRTHVVTI